MNHSVRYIYQSRHNINIFALHGTAGNGIDQSSHRYELGGISMMIEILEFLHSYYNITKGSIILDWILRKRWSKPAEMFPYSL